MGDSEERTLFCGNVSSNITEAILYELFLQMGPLVSVRVPRKDGVHRGFAFVEFKHESAVPYTLAALQGTTLDGREMTLRSNSRKHNANPRQGADSNAGRDRFGSNHNRNQQPMREQHRPSWQHQQPIREQGWHQQGHHYNQPMREHGQGDRWNNQPMRGSDQEDRGHHQGGRDHHHRHRDGPYQRDRHHQSESRHRRW